MDSTLIDSILEIIKLLVPAAAAILGVKFTLKAFEDRESKRAMADVKVKEQEIILPIRLQAYERICMLIERISPQNLLPRVNTQPMAYPELQQLLLAEIRNEVNHNLSQQVYVSEKSWTLTKQTAEAVKGIILSSARELTPDQVSGNDLARKILEKMAALSPNPLDSALDLIKREIHAKF